MSAELDMLAARGKWAAKLAKAQGQITNVPKSERNREQGYSFASAEAIFAMVRPVLSAAGLAMLADVPTLDYNPEAGRSKSGTPYASARARMGFTLIDTETGYGETASFEGFGVDYGDKAIPKALTMCAKYWARVTFMIDLRDDAEKDNIRPEPPQGKPQAPRPPTPATLQPAVVVVHERPAPHGTASDDDAALQHAADLAAIGDLFRALRASDTVIGKTLDEYGHAADVRDLTPENAAKLRTRLEAAVAKKRDAQGETDGR